LNHNSEPIFTNITHPFSNLLTSVAEEFAGWDATKDPDILSEFSSHALYTNIMTLYSDILSEFSLQFLSSSIITLYSDILSDISSRFLSTSITKLSPDILSEFS
jgi:hypothetical protein